MTNIHEPMLGSAVYVVKMDQKMGEAFELMNAPDADPKILERWRSVVESYMKRVPDNMTPLSHMASAIMAADLYVTSIADRLPCTKPATPITSTST